MNFLAQGAVMAIHDCKLKIPDDISITAYDGLILGELVSPTIDYRYPARCRHDEKSRFDLLRKNITEGSNHIKQSIVLPTKLIIRDSAAAPKV